MQDSQTRQTANEIQPVPEHTSPIDGVPVFPEDPSPPLRRRRRKWEAGGGQNINSLLDIMVILLLFLLKSYSADPVQIKPSPGLKFKKKFLENN